MAAIPQTRSILTVIVVLAVQFCIGQKSCIIWSSIGPVIKRGSSFKVYCKFNFNSNLNCKRNMYVGNACKPHQQFNSTTLYLIVENITEDRTYSCQFMCGAFDPCGLDIATGYPPDIPENISCIQKVVNVEVGVVVCTWNRGRDTYLTNTSELWVRTTSGNHTDGPMNYTGSSKGSDWLLASFNVSSSVQVISVEVHAHNQLGSVKSTTSIFTLNDIVMPSPPALAQAQCSSRACEIKLGQSLSTQHLEIQYRIEQQAWMNYTESGGKMNSENVRSVSSLEPYRLYFFRARAKFRVGLWSDWSKSISNWTQEEAPGQELDAWFAESSSELNSTTVYWKKLSDSNARGKIVGYVVNVRNPETGSDSTNIISADARQAPVRSCASCRVELFAQNSKGLSPPAVIPIFHKTAHPPRDVRVMADNRSVTIYWRKPETALLPTGYLVEWYPQRQQLEDLKWVRLGRNESHAVITGTSEIKPFECYEGSVYAFYESSVGRARFMGVSTLESAPTGSPSLQELVEGDKVTVTWMEVPRGQCGGCISKYTIYIKNNSTHSYHRLASERTYTIVDLPSASYSLWMTAWTAQGEGPRGEVVKFFIQQKSQVDHLLVWIFISLIVLVVLCQIPPVQHRLCMLFNSFKLDVVPDPANSKWARECAEEKGRMNLQLQLSDSSLLEDEPVVADVEEMPEESSINFTQGGVAIDASSRLLQPSLTPLTEPAAPPYTQTTYIKSFSHDSDNSGHTYSSEDTNMTFDYISSHEPGNGIEDEENEEVEGECMEVLDFLPSRNVFMDPLAFGGKLTLDAVKINCSDFWENG
ncbi:interleukin-12 receptor subunit beta-2 isoform 2-T2 [Polymixia lowei]